MTTQDLTKDIPFTSVKINEYRPEVIKFCAERLEELLPSIRAQISVSRDFPTLGMEQRFFDGEELSDMDAFVFWSRLFLAGFGEERRGEYAPSYLGDVADAVDVHLELGRHLGVLDRQEHLLPST